MSASSEEKKKKKRQQYGITSLTLRSKAKSTDTLTDAEDVNDDANTVSDNKNVNMDEEKDLAEEAGPFIDALSQPVSTEKLDAATAYALPLNNEDPFARQREDDRYRASQREQSKQEDISRVYKLCNDLIRKQDEFNGAMKYVTDHLQAIESRLPNVTPMYVERHDARLSMGAPVLDSRDMQSTDASRTDRSSSSKKRSSIQQSTPVRKRRSSSMEAPRSISPLEEEAARLKKTAARKSTANTSKAANASKTVHNVSKRSRKSKSKCRDESTDSETSEEASASETERPPKKQGKSAHLKVPIFKGKDFHVFKPMFEAVAKRRGWSDSEKCDQLQQALQDKAARVLSWVDPKEWTYENLMKETEAQFGETQSYADTLNKMLAMRLTPGQSLHEFAHQIQTLSREAEMDAEERGRLTRQAFVIGLTEYPGMRGYIEREDKKRDCLRTAVELAVKYTREHCTESTARTAAQVTTEKIESDAVDNVDVNRFQAQRGRQYYRGRGGYNQRQHQLDYDEEIAKLREEIERLKISKDKGETSKEMEVKDEGNKRQGDRRQQNQRWNNNRGRNYQGRGRTRFWHLYNGQYVPYTPYNQQPQYGNVHATMAVPPPPVVSTHTPMMAAQPQQPAPVQQMAAQTLAPPVILEDVDDSDSHVTDQE